MASIVGASPAPPRAGRRVARWLAVLPLLLVPLLLWLGVWQLQRGEEKRALLAAQAERAALPALAVAELAGLAEPGFRRVRLHGRFDAAHSLLLDNRLRDGRVGVELLQPFLDRPSGRWVLVNRGWLAWPDRRVPPHFATPPGELSLEARVHRPPGAAFLLGDGAAAAAGDWPRLVNAVDAAALWRELGRQGLADELRLEPGPARYVGAWPLVNMSPDKHLGYALQWFALAATLLGLTVWLAVSSTRGGMR
ncbi:SURF1 family protein [Geopseudomonas guangdongensis]|uniref:SURF1-like protein n=1 Tax=Geopseudomonas guangdongensis TaxID=1245526 RepID=A0A1H2F5K8_9GAMM|nr:SURF1 family protein [Pseudomonas guangdongensis]SDU02622.1 Cytochrome oxidase assembly protein ShyY1 [Pseudomonas guangdongensis]